MSLTHLPYELLLHIVAYVRQCDILDFSQTCRKLRCVSYERVQRYRELERKYSTFTVEAASAPKQLLQVCNDPDIALYLKSLDFRLGCPVYYGPASIHGRQPFWTSSWTREGRTKEWEMRQYSIKALFESPIFPDEHVLKVWIERFELTLETLFIGVEYRLLASLLLTICRDLRKFSLSCFGPIGVPLLGFVLLRNEEGSFNTLSKLSTFTISRNDSCSCMWIDYLARFMALPSLRHIEAVGASCEVLPAGLIAPGSSHVTKISLINCKVSAHVVSALLNTVRALNSFRYEAKIWHDEDHDSIIKSLRGCAADTLEELVMYSQRGRELTDHSILLMKGFKALRVLGLASRLVMHPNVQRTFWDALPTTVETLILYVDMNSVVCEGIHCEHENLNLYEDIGSFLKRMYLNSNMAEYQDAASRCASQAYLCRKITLQSFLGQREQEKKS